MRLITRVVPARFLRFLAVGLAGFIVDAGLLIGLIGQGVHPLLARLVSFTLAALCAWRLNRAVTFRQEGSHQLKQGARYGSVAIASGALNYAIYAVLVTVLGAGWAFVAISAATGVSMLVSYAGMARLVFR